MLGIYIYRYAGLRGTQGAGYFYVAGVLHALAMTGLAGLGGLLSGGGARFPRFLGGLILASLLFLGVLFGMRLKPDATGFWLGYAVLHPLGFLPFWYKAPRWLSGPASFLFAVWYWAWACAAIQAWILEPWRNRRQKV